MGPAVAHSLCVVAVAPSAITPHGLLRTSAAAAADEGTRRAVEEAESADAERQDDSAMRMTQQESHALHMLPWRVAGKVAEMYGAVGGHELWIVGDADALEPSAGGGVGEFAVQVPLHSPGHEWGVLCKHALDRGEYVMSMQLMYLSPPPRPSTQRAHADPHYAEPPGPGKVRFLCPHRKALLSIANFHTFAALFDCRHGCREWHW